MMVAKGLEDVRAAFKDDKLAAAFGRHFMGAYAASAFGVMPKREIDLAIFSFLIQNDVVDADGSMYRLARALNMTPARARSLLFEYQLRNVSEADTDHAVMMALTTSKYWKDGTNVSFGIQSPLVKAAITGKMQDRGVFADVSLSGDILKIDPGNFAEVLNSLLPISRAEQLAKHLKRKRVLSQSELRMALSAVLTTSANELVSKGTSATFDGALKGIKALMTGEGGMSELSGMLGSALDAM
ncbi:hypothetical protein [Brevundimonas vesicularis]|uniref:DUF1217 domain-containing protein n=1 Tax=Brevundimonas vesicularis TaxID=41276 RepID=A0ABU4KUC9_BREVE|nr:hypothetical protein [Brevundimonas vesicularis]MDX2336502.1 hypothetical protein [Brevundimonas vesicularis]